MIVVPHAASMLLWSGLPCACAFCYTHAGISGDSSALCDDSRDFYRLIALFALRALFSYDQFFKVMRERISMYNYRF